MKIRNIKFILVIIFVLINVLSINVNIYAAEGDDTYCSIIIDGKETKLRDSGVNFYVDEEVYFGEKYKLHLHAKAAGIDEDYTCWVDRDNSENVKVEFDNKEANVNNGLRTNEVDFDIIVEFNSSTATTATLFLEFGKQGTSSCWNKRIYFYNISDELYEQKQLEEAESTLDDMKNAYKNIPAANATIEEISRFIKSDAAYNGFNNFKSVSKEVAEQWKQTIYRSLQRADAIGRSMYKETYDTLEAYVNDDEETVNSKQPILSNQMQQSAEATETTIMAMRSKIEGQSRIERDDFVDVLEDTDIYIPTEEPVPTEVTKMVNVILTVITNIGMILSVLMLAILGIKYMLGSVEERANYKKDLIPYFVGAILLFGIVSIVKILQGIGQSFNLI